VEEVESRKGRESRVKPFESAEKNQAGELLEEIGVSLSRSRIRSLPCSLLLTVAGAEPACW